MLCRKQYPKFAMVITGAGFIASSQPIHGDACTFWVCSDIQWLSRGADVEGCGGRKNHTKQRDEEDPN